jgi:hypothetical protein
MSAKTDHINSFIFGIIFLILIFSFGQKEKDNNNNGTLGNAITLPLIHSSDTQGITITASFLPELAVKWSKSNEWYSYIEIQNKVTSETLIKYHQKFLFLTQFNFIVFRQKAPPQVTGEEPPHIA